MGDRKHLGIIFRTIQRTMVCDHRLCWCKDYLERRHLGEWSPYSSSDVCHSPGCWCSVGGDTTDG